ncbi:PREDICTED: pentatricopeptide repeat-containing protein At1g71460, chloroplastic-like [Lupinus angustifolius]|nr:PREDICTED: pentatricopeptide repeat-containing protein At1g71460, chloroplastic-like [Lupinus angustifolius]
MESSLSSLLHSHSFTTLHFKPQSPFLLQHQQPLSLSTSSFTKIPFSIHIHQKGIPVNPSTPRKIYINAPLLSWDSTSTTHAQMRALELELNESRFRSVVSGFAGSNSILEGFKVHGVLIKNGFLPSSVVMNACLVELYFKFGEIELARRVFDESCHRDVFLWGAMIGGFVRNRLPMDALEYVRLMVEDGMRLNSVLVIIILPVIGKVRARRIGKEVHAYILKTRLDFGQAAIQLALVDMYCKCGEIGLGRRVLYSSMERKVGSWNAVMSGYASIGRLEQAIRSTIWVRKGFRPGVVAIATALPIYAHSRALKQGKEIHAYALRHCFLPHVSIVSSLMVLYSKCGVIEYSLKLFDWVEQRNVILWTAMIDSYVESGRMYEALGIIRSMQLTEHRPDTVTIARMLSVCGELKLEKLGKEIHGQVLKRDFTSVHYVSAELINMYGTCGVVEKAKLVFDAVPVKGSMIWTALIRAYGYKKLYRDAIDLLDQMVSNGCSPNTFTFQAVLSICDRAGLVEDALRIFNLISRYKIEASKEHCILMIRLLTRYGKLDKALGFVEMISSLE